MKSVLTAATAAVAALSTPAMAQVQGNIAVVNAPAAVTQSQALQAAFGQIDASFQPQTATMQQRIAQRQTLLQQLDTNSDGNLDEAEQAAAQNTPQWQQIAQIEQEVSAIQTQIDRSSVYVVDQVLRQYGPALQQVVTQNNIQMVFAPDAIAWSSPTADITAQVIAALNAAFPTALTTVPAEWQPSRQAVALYRQIVEAQRYYAIQQAQQQAAQQQPPQASGDTRY